MNNSWKFGAIPTSGNRLRLPQRVGHFARSRGPLSGTFVGNFVESMSAILGEFERTPFIMVQADTKGQQDLSPHVAYSSLLATRRARNGPCSPLRFSAFSAACTNSYTRRPSPGVLLWGRVGAREVKGCLRAAATLSDCSRPRSTPCCADHSFEPNNGALATEAGPTHFLDVRHPATQFRSLAFPCAGCLHCSFHPTNASPEATCAEI